MSWNYLAYLIELTRNQESPTEYWRWAGIASLAATLRNNCFISTQTGIVYPNIYVVLYAESGLTRKASPCKFVGKLVRKTNNTKFIGGRASIQGVIKELATNYTTEKGFMLEGASALLYSEELSSFIVDDPVAIPLLIDLYDYHESWDSQLISSSFKLKEVCLSLLCASNSDLFRSVFTDRAIKGGLLGRTFIVKEEKARHRKSLLDLITYNGEYNIEPLLKHLEKLTKLRGEVKITNDAQEEYNNWYYNIPDSIFADRIGFGSRLGTHVLKVAMALGAARVDFNCLLIKEDIQRAIELCQGIRQNYKKITVGIGSSNSSQQASQLIQAILRCRNYHISHRVLAQTLFGDVELQDMENILKMLISAGLIQEMPLNNEPGYRLTAQGIKTLIEGEQPK